MATSKASLFLSSASNAKQAILAPSCCMLRALFCCRVDCQLLLSWEASIIEPMTCKQAHAGPHTSSAACSMAHTWVPDPRDACNAVAYRAALTPCGSSNAHPLMTTCRVTTPDQGPQTADQPSCVQVHARQTTAEILQPITKHWQSKMREAH